MQSLTWDKSEEAVESSEIYNWRLSWFYDNEVFWVMEYFKPIPNEDKS